LTYEGLEEENLDQKSPGSPGWGLMQRASSSLIIKKQEMLKNQTSRHGKQTEIKKTFLILKINERDIIKNVYRSASKVLAIIVRYY